MNYIKWRGILRNKQYPDGNMFHLSEIWVVERGFPDALQNLRIHPKTAWIDFRNIRHSGKLAQYILVLFEETVRAMFNKALREELVAFNPVFSLNVLEHFHATTRHASS